jgi:lipoyl(octanoyl) transferase
MTIQIKDLGMRDYGETYDAMCVFNQNRDSATKDQIWLLEHSPVYTLGLAGKTEHLLNTNNIPVINTDRGGQVTYHGPGQLVAYLLIDLSRRAYSIKKFVSLIEASIIDCLSDYGIKAERLYGAPGVYVNGEKIAALGIRVKKGCAYHGLALNIDMDLMPFKGINPCGYKEMVCTHMIEHNKDITLAEVKIKLSECLVKHLDQATGIFSDVA